MPLAFNNVVSFSFKVPRVRLFHGLPPPLPSSLPCRRSWSHIPVAATTHLSRVAFSFSLPQLLAVPPFSMTAGTLPSYPRATTTFAFEQRGKWKRNCSTLPTFRSRYPSSPSAFFHLSHFLSLFLSLSFSYHVSFLPSIALHALYLSSPFPLFLSQSLFLFLTPFRYTRQPYFPLWLTRSRLLSFLPPRGCHPPSTLLIFPPLSLKLKSIVAPRARGLCRKHCYPHQLLPTQTPAGVFLRRQLIFYWYLVNRENFLFSL